ncbi:beta-L-arabinofuranosidase domain-containing protein [Streptomyces sp. NPDC026673]|uniref:glycoside hydrolase family 127 protein n=1 Tax=Streptomyces sp. NPDC026673 TaxID=3155724 RepID=UPI0033D864CB
MTQPIPAPVLPTHGSRRPLGLGEVRITGGFWARRQQVNASATLDHCRQRMERAGWIDNFRIAASGGPLGERRRGREFSDSEVYKLLEAMVWESARTPGTPLDAAVDELADTVAAAQEADGYLNTAFGHPGRPPRYSDLEWGHELYCLGHLIQAGVAQLRTRGDGALAKAAIRAADHVCHVFGPEGGNPGLCGHPEIETALAELHRATGERRYLDQAALFVERRGHGTLAGAEFAPAYFQDDVPVRRAHTLRGHAVRALYLASGAVDVAVETGDDELLAAVVRQWEHTTARRTHLTGGMGSHHSDEGFGEDFVLPPDRAYSETCASVASLMLGWRLLLATGDPRYADLAERTLYNVIAASPADDGRSFFYANTLHQRVRATVPPSDSDSPRPAPGLRAPWYAVSCCLPNVARTLAALGGYVATADADGLQLYQYADAEITTRTPGGERVALRMRTDYPEGGTVVVTVDEAPEGRWSLALRVPGWADGAWLVVPGGQRRPVRPGMAVVPGTLRPGDEVRLELPVTPRWVHPDPRVDAVRGTVAVERGPVVYCAESPDLPDGRDVDAVTVDPSVAPRDGAGGRVVVTGELTGAHSTGWWPYLHDRPPVPAAVRTELTLVPYLSWASRGPSTMRVWLPVTPGAAGEPDPAPEG